MRGDPGDRTRLQHILDAIFEIESYTRQVGFDDFVENSMMRFASIKQLEIIGEAANSLNRSVQTKILEHRMASDYRIEKHLSPPLFWN